MSLKCASRSLATLRTHLADAFDVPCCWLLEDQGANEQNCHEQNFKRFGIVTCPRALGEIPCTVFVPEAFRKGFKKLWRAGLALRGRWVRSRNHFTGDVSHETT